MKISLVGCCFNVEHPLEILPKKVCEENTHAVKVFAKTFP